MTGVNLARSIVDQSRVRPDLRLGTIQDQITLEQAVSFAAGRAQDLLDSGLRPGNRVALIAPTSTDYLITWLACLLAGAPVALVNPTYPDELIDRMLDPLSPDLILREGGVSLARTCGHGDPEALAGTQVDRFAVASYMHTSGTTGLPKFCAQTHEYFAKLAASIADVLDMGPNDRVLAPLPMFHINPLGYGVVAAILAGADVLTVEKFSASQFWPNVVDQRITVMILHAPPVEILKRATSAENALGHVVRTMFFADAQFMEKFDVRNAVSGYGSTEAGGISHLQRWSLEHKIPADASRHGGHPRPGIEWRLDEVGSIEIRETEPGTLFAGYVTPTGLESARDDDGWFATGDLGEARHDDYLVFLERAAESIRVKGEFVPIPFVENHLAGLEGLHDHALWKRKGELVDEEVVLYVVTDGLSIDAVKTRIADLPTFMRPVAVAQVEALPRDEAVGKVRRRLLGDLAVIEWTELE